MVKLANGLKILRENLELREQVAQLQAEIDAMKGAMEYMAFSLNGLASELVKTPTFTDWLLEQDASSKYRYVPCTGGVVVEGQDDLTLALKFAGRAQ